MNMKIKLNTFQILFLSLYILFNTYALFYLLIEKETFGDYFEVADNTYFIFLSYISVILPFIFFGLVVYPYFEYKLKINKLKIKNYLLENKIGLFLLILQILFIFFNLIAGVNFAGSENKTDSSLKYIFIVLSPDLLFFIFYGYARNNKYFKYNLTIYLISNFLRGWMGGLYFVLIIELYIYYKKYGISKKIFLNISVLFVILLSVLPYINALKWFVRAYLGNEGAGLLNELSELIIIINNSYFDSFVLTINNLLGRFQILSNVYLELENINLLQKARENDEIVSLFLVGLPQLSIYKIFNLDYNVLNSFLLVIIDKNLVLAELTSNTHVGWIGWVLVEPHFILIYIVYCVFLIYISIFLCNKIGGEYIHFINWLLVLVYLLHGWLQAYIAYIISMFIFYLLIVFFKKLFSYKY